MEYPGGDAEYLPIEDGLEKQMTLTPKDKANGNYRNETPPETKFFYYASNLERGTNKVVEASSKALLSQFANSLWHTDSSYKKHAALASLLHARVVPPAGSGGGIEFASVRMAWDALPEEEKKRFERLVVVHDWCYSRGNFNREWAHTRPWDEELPPVRHPLVRQTERGKTLYVGAHACHVEGMELDEGRELIMSLNRYVSSPRFTFEHSWRPNQLVIWDNRCCLHRGRPWLRPFEHPRDLRRTTIAGSCNEVQAAGRGDGVGVAAAVPSLAQREELLKAAGMDLDAPASEEGAPAYYFRWTPETLF